MGRLTSNDLQYFRHSSGMYNSKEMQRLKKRGGFEAVARFWIFAEYLANSDYSAIDITDDLEQESLCDELEFLTDFEPDIEGLNTFIDLLLKSNLIEQIENYLIFPLDENNAFRQSFIEVWKKRLNSRKKKAPKDDRFLLQITPELEIYTVTDAEKEDKPVKKEFLSQKSAEKPSKSDSKEFLSQQTQQEEEEEEEEEEEKEEEEGENKKPRTHSPRQLSLDDKIKLSIRGSPPEWLNDPFEIFKLFNEVVDKDYRYEKIDSNLFLPEMMRVKVGSDIQNWWSTCQFGASNNWFFGRPENFYDKLNQNASGRNGKSTGQQGIPVQQARQEKPC